MFDYAIDKIIQIISDFIRKIHCNCKSRCCWDCMEVSTNIFQRSCTKRNYDKL